MPSTTVFPSATTWFCELPDKGLLLIKGPDAAKFLQGQITCDIRELADNNSRIGAQCNIKGRVLASFRTMQMDTETIALMMPADNIESTQKTLGKYIVFSKATLQDCRNDFRILGCYGVDCEKKLSQFFTSIPSHRDTWTTHNGNYLIKLDENRFECWINGQDYPMVIETLSAKWTAAPINAWELLDIRAGIYWVNAASTEQFTPHELNYPYLNAVNFRKGCYTGQEIVARMHYRGKLKRHTHRFLIDAIEMPIFGSALHPAPDKTFGEILSCAINEADQVECLAICDDEQALSMDSEKIKRLELPYAIPKAEDSTASGD